MAVSTTARIVNVYLTAPVVNYLYHAQYGQNEDFVITQVDGSGGVFVDLASKLDEEGSGVWIGASGNEVHGLDDEGDDAVSEKAEAFEDKVNAGLAAVDTRIEQLEHEIKHWQRVAGEHYSTLVKHGLDGMPPSLVMEPTDDAAARDDAAASTRSVAVRYKGYEFKITGMVNVGNGLSKTEVMEELYDQVKGQRSEHLKDMEVENTKVKRIKK